MKLISREQIEKLAKFKSSKFLTTSFYLDTKKRKKTKKEVNLAMKNLMSKGKSLMEGMSIDRDQKESLLKDLELIDRYRRRRLASYKAAGLALFSCAGEGFFQEFELPNSPLNRIIFDHNPYVRLLSAIVNEHPRICTLTIDRKEAKWHDIFMGEISPMDSMAGDIPKRVKEGGWEGYESKRIERHINQQLKDYFKRAAQNTFRLFKEREFDWLFLGCQDEYCTEFDTFLHPYIKNRMKGRLKAGSGEPPDRILQKTEALVKDLKVREKEEILNR
jgi:peptide subunit release factor 1 (eRF1)